MECTVRAQAGHDRDVSFTIARNGALASADDVARMLDANGCETMDPIECVEVEIGAKFTRLHRVAPGEIITMRVRA